MEQNNWKVLFDNNYHCKGICEGLASQMKQKGNITYIGWAVAQRLFEQQDGVIEVMTSENGQKVFIETYKDSTSEFNAYFVQVKAKWMGREYIEYYPMQDYANKPLKVFNQNDINKNIQRAKAKAIAIVSGIGYALYEKGDLQFEDDSKPTKETKQETKPPKQESSDKIIKIKGLIFNKLTELGYTREQAKEWGKNKNLQTLTAEELQKEFEELCKIQ